METYSKPQIKESVLHVQYLPPADASLSVGLDQVRTGPSIRGCGGGNLWSFPHNYKESCNDDAHLWLMLPNLSPSPNI